MPEKITYKLDMHPESAKNAKLGCIIKKLDYNKVNNFSCRVENPLMVNIGWDGLI